MERRANCRCEKPPTADANKSQTDWYKEIYSRMHVLPENVVIVKLPPTRPRYLDECRQRDTQINPYQPTYKFPKEFDGNLQLMEDYIRKMASQNLDEDDEPTQSSSPITNVKDCRTTAMKTHEKYSHYSSPIDQIKLQPNTIVAPTSHSSKPTNNNEQRSIYKRILRGGEIPMAGLQKFIDKPVQQASESASISTENVDQIRGQNPSINERQHFSSVDDDRRSKTNSPIYKAVALHNFYAQSNRELSFKKGDTFPVKRRINDNWLEGEHQGVIGIFPSNHVELFPIDTKESNNNHGEAIVKYDFIPQNHFELQLQKGEKVILLRRLNNNWYKGRSNNFEGIFPAGYVETLREPTDNLNSTFSFDSDRENQSDRSSENDSRIRSPLTMSSVKPKSVLKSSKSTVDRLDRSSESPAPMRKCQVLYDYLPQNSDELEIHVGDIITIVEMCDDGWYCGLMEKSKFANKMEFGTFPGNYVKILSGNS